MKALGLATLLVIGCGGKDGGEDWSTRPLEEVTANTDGILFSIKIPKGMRQKEAAGGGVVWDFLVDGRVYSPDITVRAAGYADTLEKYVETEKRVDNWLRKDTLPDGYVATYENASYKGREDYLVYVYKKVGDKVLTCSARVTPWVKGGKTKDKVPLVENMCLSMRAK